MPKICLFIPINAYLSGTTFGKQVFLYWHVLASALLHIILCVDKIT